MARPNGVVSIADQIPDIPGAQAPTPPSNAPQDTLPAQVELAEQSPPPQGLSAYADPPAEETSAPVAEQTEAPAEVEAPKEVVAEKMPATLSLDLVKKTEYSGNTILEMTTAQRSAYDREVDEVREKIRGAERAYVLAQWYMGSTAMKLQRDAKDNHGSLYGQATVEGFAHDIGRDKSTVYKSMKLAKGLTFAHAQALTITVEAFQVIQRAPDKVREWVLETVVKRCQSGQKFDTNQIERVVETLTWYPSIADQTDKPAEVAKAIDAVVAWDPKPLPGKDKPEFDLDAAKKVIAGSAPDLLPVVKSDEKSFKASEKAKREQPGVNSKTGTSHIGVAKTFSKALDTIIEKAGSLTISMNEAPDDDLSEKAYENFSEIILKITEDVDNAIDVLKGIKEAAEALTEPAPEKVTKTPKRQAKPRSSAKKKK
jgi:hypothetical protein